METRTRKLVIGLATCALVLCSTNAILAGPPPWKSIAKLSSGYAHKWTHFPPKPYPPQPWPHHTYYPGGLIPAPVVRPVIISNTSDFYATNPAPAADIRLVNPAENGVTLRYQLDNGPVRLLPAGYTVAIRQAVVISFDLGGNAGQARYKLGDGTYAFTAVGGAWNLVRQAVGDEPTPQYADATANPVPGK